ncbi:hypothetical protein [Desulfosporosinus sp. SB140]|uniref:hypothetical protein n=1 Tax=Desulfosporosinus paludis TaxID=3115649 RepID=UPI0038905B03
MCEVKVKVGINLKKVMRWIGLVITIVVVFAISIKNVDYNSLANKNTRNLERLLSQNTYYVNGNVKNLITIDYDKMYVFQPYQSLDEMERQIEFLNESNRRKTIW